MTVIESVIEPLGRFSPPSGPPLASTVELHRSRTSLSSCDELSVTLGLTHRRASSAPPRRHATKYERVTSIQNYTPEMLLHRRNPSRLLMLVNLSSNIRSASGFSTAGKEGCQRLGWKGVGGLVQTVRGHARYWNCDSYTFCEPLCLHTTSLGRPSCRARRTDTVLGRAYFWLAPSSVLMERATARITSSMDPLRAQLNPMCHKPITTSSQRPDVSRQRIYGPPNGVHGAPGFGRCT
ncbi:hypothetical protein B0H16DRAFT_1739728 [Mycena metata]|uniref:Uncharacterized protein n=1 Tax=Mycena metata TaxID=1033252 RepID=A0AAD7HEM7_9AGAR|nr:hypothetical protein B0H16DRAFT_1739728 [Mycena metata]